GRSTRSIKSPRVELLFDTFACGAIVVIRAHCVFRRSGPDRDQPSGKLSNDVCRRIAKRLVPEQLDVGPSVYIDGEQFRKVVSEKLSRKGERRRRLSSTSRGGTIEKRQVRLLEDLDIG